MPEQASPAYHFYVAPTPVTVKPPPLPPRRRSLPPPTRASKAPKRHPSGFPAEEADTRVQSLQRRAADMIYTWRDFPDLDQRWHEELIATWHLFSERDKRWLRDILHVMRAGNEKT